MAASACARVASVIGVERTITDASLENSMMAN